MLDFSLPLFPGQKSCACHSHGDSCRRIPVFGKDCRDSCHTPPGSKAVTLTNPMNPCESVTVLLSIDGNGNLVVCVRR